MVGAFIRTHVIIKMNVGFRKDVVTYDGCFLQQKKKKKKRYCHQGYVLLNVEFTIVQYGPTCSAEVNIKHRLCAGVPCGLLSRW